MEHRPYDELADLARMERLLTDGRAAQAATGYWHIGDLEWKAFGPHGLALSEVFHLWEEGGALAGFVALSADSFDYQTAGGHRGTPLEREMVEWGRDAVLGWRAANGLEAACAVECWAEDAHRRGLLESMGFHETDRGAVLFERGLNSELPPVEAPAGFDVRGLREPDIESRAITQQLAFAPGSKTTPATWRHMVANAPAYDPDLDSLAVTAEGTTVAAALAWLDETNRCGEFEPVGTRPDFQRRGLARAILARGLAKMRERGMTTAIVGTNQTNAAAIAAYQSVGFRIRHRIVEYELAGRPGSAASGG